MESKKKNKINELKELTKDQECDTVTTEDQMKAIEDVSLWMLEDQVEAEQEVIEQFCKQENFKWDGHE